MGRAVGRRADRFHRGTQRRQRPAAQNLQNGGVTPLPGGCCPRHRIGELTVAAGFSGHGFKFVPLVGRLVADLVSGVMYTIHDLNDVQAPFDGWLSLTATGSGEFEPLEASTRPPPLPEKLSINGVTLPLVDTVVPREAPIWLGWAPDSDGDIIYIDIDPVPSASVDRIRCAFSDTGLAEIPRQAIPDTTEMMIAVHRSRYVALRSDRGEVGMAHFDLAVTSRVTFASP